MLRPLASLLLTLSLGCIPPFSPPSAQTLARELTTKTVALVEADDDLDYCSGVWVGPKTILTANHCVADKEVGDYVEYAVVGDVVEYPAEERINSRIAVVSEYDGSHDLALLRVNGVAPDHGVAEVASGEIQVGDHVETMGGPLGMVWSYSSGEVAAIRYVPGDDDNDGIWYIQATAPISPGNSGGGLFDDRGRLIGITRAYMPRGELVNLFVHKDYIVRFLAP